MSDFLNELYAKAFRYHDKAGAVEIEDKNGNILGYQPFVTKASADGLSEEYLNRIYTEELASQKFETEREAREYAINFLRNLRTESIK